MVPFIFRHLLLCLVAVAEFDKYNTPINNPYEEGWSCYPRCFEKDIVFQGINRDVASHAGNGHLFAFVQSKTEEPFEYKLERTVCKIGNYTEGALELKFLPERDIDGKYYEQSHNVTIRCRIPNVALYHQCCSRYPNQPNSIPAYQPETVEVQVSIDGGRRWMQSRPPAMLQLMWDYAALVQTQSSTDLAEANDLMDTTADSANFVILQGKVS